MIYYAIVMGTAQAFVTPARDGLLNQVAEGGIQPAVVRASMMQFGVQLAGLGIASFAERVGALPILLVQALVLAARRALLRADSRSTHAGRAGTSPPARHRSGHRARLSHGRRVAGDAHNRTAEHRDGPVFHGLVHRHVAAAGARVLRRLGRRSRADERGECTRARHHDLHSDPLRRHPPAGSRAVALAGARCRDARCNRHRRQLYDVVGADLPVGNGRRHRDEHGAHDHAGGGAGEPTQPRDELLLVRVHGFRTDRRAA